MRTTPLYHSGTLVRRPSPKQFVVNELPLILTCIAGLVVAGMDDAPSDCLLFWASLAIGLCLVYHFFYLKLTVFHITPEQLIYEHGVFHRTRDYLELYRVVDFREDSNFLQQLFGIKTIRLYSGDRTLPCLKMSGVAVHDNLIHHIRERVNYNRKKNGIYEIANR